MVMPNTFVPGEDAKASEVNENFEHLVDELGDLDNYVLAVEAEDAGRFYLFAGNGVFRGYEDGMEASINGTDVEIAEGAAVVEGRLVVLTAVESVAFAGRVADTYYVVVDSEANFDAVTVAEYNALDPSDPDLLRLCQVDWDTTDLTSLVDVREYVPRALELRPLVQGEPDIAVGAEVSNVINVAVQLKDAGDLDVEGEVACRVWLSDNPKEGKCSAAPDGGVKIGTDGIILEEIDADLHIIVISDSDGKFDLDLEESGAKTLYVNVEYQGHVFVSGVVEFEV